jgi:nonsense-mediated mRNA decay protein 3
MSLGEEFCIVCGGKPPLYINRLCESCLRVRHTISRIDDRIQYTRCSRSGTIQTDQGWIELEDEELHNLLVEKNLELHEIAKDVVVDITAQKIDDRNTRLFINVEGNITNLPFQDRHETLLRCSNGVSTAASRKAGNYFEATVQLRSIGRKLEESELNSLRQSLTTFIDGLPNDPMHFITKEGPVQGGYDVVFGSKGLARSWARELTKRWGGQTKESNKIVGRKDGNDVTRLTIVYRKPAFDVGDILLWRSEYYRVFAWLSNGVTLLRINRNHRIGTTWRDLETVQVVCRTDEQITVTPLNVDSHVIEFLDERDWKTKMVSLPWDWNDSRENVELAYIVDEWISLPMLTSQGDVQNHHADSNDT